jgi:hypothetical protein
MTAFTCKTASSLILAFFISLHALQFESGRVHKQNKDLPASEASFIPRSAVVQVAKHDLKRGTKTNKRTVPTERQPLVGEVSANFCG